MIHVPSQSLKKGMVSMFSACEVYDCDNLESDSKKRPARDRKVLSARSSLVDLVGITELRMSPGGSSSVCEGLVGHGGLVVDFITFDACTLHISFCSTTRRNQLTVL